MRLFKRQLKRIRGRNTEPEPASFLEMLVDSLRLAALPAREQISALPDFVDVPGEVAQYFEDAWVLVPQIREADLLSDDQFEAVAKLKRAYDAMENAEDADALWTVEGMRNDKCWSRSRELAAQALLALGRSLDPPHFRGVTWVPAAD